MSAIKEKLKLDNKTLILVLLIAALILYLDCNFIIKAQLNGINSLKPKVVKIKKDIESLNNDSANIESLKNRQGQQVGLKIKKIILEEQLPELLEEISNTANKNNIRIMQIKPVREIKTKEDKAITDNFQEAGSLLNIEVLDHVIVGRNAFYSFAKRW